MKEEKDTKIKDFTVYPLECVWKKLEEEKLDKKQKTSRGNIKDREEVNKKILSSQKVFNQSINSINKNYENSQNKIKNKIEEYNLYLVFTASILTIMTLGWTIFYSVINNEYQNNRSKIFSMPKNFFKINLYENIMIWLYILIPPLLYIFYKKVKGIKIPFYLCEK